MERARELFERIRSRGETAIDELIATRESEKLFLEFKRSADGGVGTSLHNKDRTHLAKAISGFGNSAGGVVLWGIECSRDAELGDVARVKHPIHNVARFVSNLEGAVSGCTLPPHSEVQHVAVTSDGQEPNGDRSGFVATYIPESNRGPHQVANEHYYYIRAGSNFLPAPHGVLQGMFGRRPQASLFHMFRISPPDMGDHYVGIDLGLVICNSGPLIASEVYMSVLAHSHPGGGNEVGFRPTDPHARNWITHEGISQTFSAISKEHYRLPPDANVEPLVLELTLKEPIERRLKIDVTYGCKEGLANRFTILSERETMVEELTRMSLIRSKGELTEERWGKFVRHVLRLEHVEGWWS